MDASVSVRTADTAEMDDEHSSVLGRATRSLCHGERQAELGLSQLSNVVPSARLIDDAEAPALGRLRSSAAAASAPDGGEHYVPFPITASVAFRSSGLRGRCSGSERRNHLWPTGGYMG